MRFSISHREYISLPERGGRLWFVAHSYALGVERVLETRVISGSAERAQEFQ